MLNLIARRLGPSRKVQLYGGLLDILQIKGHVMPRYTLL